MQHSQGINLSDMGSLGEQFKPRLNNILILNRQASLPRSRLA